MANVITQSKSPLSFKVREARSDATSCNNICLDENGHFITVDSVEMLLDDLQGMTSSNINNLSSSRGEDTTHVEQDSSQAKVDRHHTYRITSYDQAEGGSPNQEMVTCKSLIAINQNSNACRQRYQSNGHLGKQYRPIVTSSPQFGSSGNEALGAKLATHKSLDIGIGFGLGAALFPHLPFAGITVFVSKL